MEEWSEVNMGKEDREVELDEWLVKAKTKE